MISFKSFMFISTIIMFENIYCSEQAEVLEDHRNEVLEQNNPIAPVMETMEVKNELILKNIIEPIKPSSTFFTRAWYGATKHILKQSNYAIFMELNQSGRLKTDYDNNPSEPINRFNETVAERFTNKDIHAYAQQEKIAHLFEVAAKIDDSFLLVQALASKYIKMQKDAATQIINHQAFVIEPQLKKEKNEAIALARKTYKDKLEAERKISAHAASNYRYLHDRSQASGEHENQDNAHYKNLSTFFMLLKRIQRDAEPSEKKAARAEKDLEKKRVRLVQAQEFIDAQKIKK